MRRRTGFLLLLLVAASCLWFVRHTLEKGEVFICDLNGVELRTTRGEMRKDGALLFGYLDDGREVAVGRYGLERCKRW